MVSGLRGTSYQEKLKKLGIASLEDRRKRFDLIQVYRILNNIDKVDSNQWFTRIGDRSSQATRLAADPNNLVKPKAKTELRRNFFSIRVIDSWNALPGYIKQSRTLQTFKSSQDRHLHPTDTDNENEL